MSDQETLDDISQQVNDRVQAEIEHMPPPEESTDGTPDDPRFVLQCLENNERGDGVLYAALHRGKFTCNKSKKDKPWLMWQGHHWQSDHMDRSMMAVENVALTYGAQASRISAEIAELREALKIENAKIDSCKEAEDDAGQRAAMVNAEQLSADIGRLTSKRNSLNKRMDRLRGVRGANNCLTWAHCIDNPLAIVGDEIDLKPWLLACPNGVIDLQTGELKPGNPDDYLVRAVPTHFPEGSDVAHYLATGEGCQATNWVKFIGEIHEGKQEIIDFVHRFCGYCATGLRVEHFLACFIGEGANGKGTMFETIQEVLGELSWSIDPEMLLEQKNARSSGGPNADIVSLQGRRFVVASETEEGRRISTAAVKRLTGGDTLKGRSPHDKYEINFKPTHKLILYTNHPPRGLAKDFAMFRRLLYLWYPLRYVNDPEKEQEKDPQNAHIYRQKDPDLPEKLKAEAPWILAWIVRGCLLWQQEGGLKPPHQLRAAAEAIRNEEDNVGRFVEDVCIRVDTDCRLQFKSFYDAFKAWYEENVDENDRFRKSKKSVAEELRRKGYKVPPAKETGGTLYVYGLHLPPAYGF
jgi:putative DNA primase/helicase